MNAASEHLSAEFILSASILLDLTPANVNKASIAMDRIVLVRTSKFVHVHRSCYKFERGKYNDFGFFRSSAASTKQQYSVASDFIRMFPMFTSNVFDQIC